MSLSRFDSLFPTPLHRKSFFACVAALAFAAPAGAAEQTINSDLWVNGWVRAGTTLNAASGYSVAIGYNADAVGGHCAAFGFNTTANAHSTLVCGIGTTANGQGSCALGAYSTASSYGELAIGQYNTIPSPAPSITTWNSGERLLVLGMGASTTARADALVVLKNGNLTGNGTDNRLPFQATLPDGSSILTRALGDSRYFTNTNSQIILGANHIGNSSAAIIVGNGIPGTPANSLIISKTGDASLNGLTAAGAVSLASTLAVTGQTTVTALALSGNVTGTGTNNTLANQQLTAAGSIVTRDLGDARYFNNNDPQIVVGSFEVPDSNAALIIGNGIDANNRSNSFVVKKDGAIVVTGGQSDLSMGTFN